MKFKSLNNVYETYGKENIITIRNLKQIIAYAKHFKVQPIWVDEGYGGVLVAYYYKPDTNKAWDYWLKTNPKLNGGDK